jgi:hypothetical protein
MHNFAKAGIPKPKVCVPVLLPGGRQLDYAPSALDMLPAVVAAVGGRVPVWMDGGIRRGTDVLKVSRTFRQQCVPAAELQSPYTAVPCL